LCLVNHPAADFHRLPLPVLLEQIIEGLDGQGVHGGIPLNCQHPKRALVSP
jgi:hypothetical protein